MFKTVSILSLQIFLSSLQVDTEICYTDFYHIKSVWLTAVLSVCGVLNIIQKGKALKSTKSTIQVREQAHW